MEPSAFKIKEIALAVTTDGDLLSWGTGADGRLGHDSVEDVDEPKRIQHLTVPIAYAAYSWWIFA